MIQCTSLKGIEHFTSLMELNCNNNKLSNLDVSHNLNLVWLDCDNNQLTNLDVSHNPNLKGFACCFNQLTNIDVSHNLYLELLQCSNITNIDVSHNLYLRTLHCFDTQLTSIDVSHNPNLEEFVCCLNQLTSIDVSHNPNLEEFVCCFNQLTSIDVSHNPKLINLDCSNNQLTSIDVSHNPSLKEFYCYSNELTSLKLNKQVYDKLSLKNSYLHNKDHSDTIPEKATAILSNLSNVTEVDGIIKVTDMNKPATYTYTYNGKKIDFTILYIDPAEESEKTFAITYILNGGTNAVENPTTYTEGIGVASLANPTKPNATFDGWYLDAAFTKKITSIGADQTGNLTLYAKFTSTFSVLENEVTSSCMRLFYDYDYKNSVSGTAITLYGNCKKNTDTIKKDITLYTDILASYNYALGRNGKIKASTGKVIAGITMSDTKPVLNRGKIVDTAAAKIAKVKIKHGQITITSVGKMAGTVYLWVMDTGKKEVVECYPIQVKLAPKKLEVQNLSGSKASKLKVANGNSVNVQVVGLVGTVKTQDCEYTATVNSSSGNYVSVEKISYFNADGTPRNNVFSIKGIGLKNKKDTKVSITFTCTENGKKVKFSATITKAAMN